jgi:hypothetical protein
MFRLDTFPLIPDAQLSSFGGGMFVALQRVPPSPRTHPVVPFSGRDFVAAAVGGAIAGGMVSRWMPQGAALAAGVGAAGNATSYCAQLAVKNFPPECRGYDLNNPNSLLKLTGLQVPKPTEL